MVSTEHNAALEFNASALKAVEAFTQKVLIYLFIYIIFFGAEDDTVVTEPVKRLPVLFPHCDEHLVGAVQLLSIFHPHNVRFCHSLNSAAEPDLFALRHRLIGWMFRKQHSCGRKAGA